MTGPLQGVRVLDLSTIVSGPMASQIMADQGAEVIKVEAPPGGDGTRHLGPSRGGMGAAFHMLNRGKRSIVLDLKNPEGVVVLRQLAARTDVLIQNFRPRVMQRLGLDPAGLRAANPGLITVSISGFGGEGPLADKPAFDHVMQCYAGFVALQAGPDGTGEPVLIRNIMVDKLTALTASQAVTAALFARERGAGGQEVKLSMLSAALAFLWPDAAGPHHLRGPGAEMRPALSERARLYAFANGHGTFNGTDVSFAALCRILDAPTGSDPRLRDAPGRSSHPELMEQVMREWEVACAKLDVDEAMPLIAATGAPCAKVLTLGEVMEEEQVRADRCLRDVEHPLAGTIREPRPAAEFSGTPLAMTAPGPTLGQHTGEILGELGYDEAARARLKAQGALG